jgi:hypothetical protein
MDLGLVEESNRDRLRSTDHMMMIQTKPVKKQTIMTVNARGFI